jgi:hypothetical protein
MEFLDAVALTAIFIMVFMFSLRSLGEIGMFGRRATLTIAACVAALSVIGMIDFVHSNSGGPSAIPLSPQPAHDLVR